MIRRIVGLGVDNPVLLNLLFTLVCVAGLLSWNRLPKEEFPQVETDSVVASVAYPGASPEDVEDLLLRPIEDVVENVEGVDHVFSDALEGLGIVQVEFVRGTDVDAARLDIEREINALSSMPADALAPQVNVAKLVVPLISVGLIGDRRDVDLADEISDELAAFSGVKGVDMFGQASREVRVTLRTAEAVARGVSPAMLARTIEAAGLGAPAGTVEREQEGVLVRTPRALNSLDDIRGIPLQVNGGVHVTVDEVADVAWSWTDATLLRRCNGQPCIAMVVLREDAADALKVVPEIQQWVEQRRTTLPAGYDLVAYDDSARLVQSRLRTLGSNGLVGIVLVGALLVLFIGGRNTALVIWGMPVAYLGAVAMMDVFGVTANVVSTFGLLVVTGIIVDDAIVIVENVQRHLEMGKGRVQAALDGTTEVSGAVFAATLTTCLAFAPLLMLEGAVGRVMRFIPLVVILSLVASLFEAFFVLPGHLAHHAEEQDGTRENLPTRMLKRGYEPVLRWVTRGRNRYMALVGVVVALMATLSLATMMKLSLTTKGEPVFALVNIDLAPGSSVEQTEAVVRRMEQHLLNEASPWMLWMASTSGRQLAQQGFPTIGPRYGQIKVGFQKTPETMDEVRAFLPRLRETIAADPEVVAVELETLTGGPPAGRPVDVRVRGREPERVTAVARELGQHLMGRPATRDVKVELRDGAQTFEIRVDREQAAVFGLREAQVAMAARAALDGELAIELPLGERATEVRVSWPEEQDRAALADTPIVLSDGTTIRLRQVAEVERVTGLERIQRVDGQRAVRVSAQIDAFATSASDEQQALETAFAEMIDPNEELELFYGGELADTEKSFGQLPYAMALAIGMIYAVLAIQFRSYLQPLIILFAVPLGMAGVVLGLFTFGMDLSLIASIGAVGLAGIVVNDSLVLVDFVNLERKRGATVSEAVVQASLTRLRPILITTVTTVCGLLPLALGLAGEEPLLAPMAVAISFGLSFATGLTLIAVPVLYLVIADLERRLGMGREV
ncbi:MAG: efflux RND transporter permease subunit [Myxococcota bacterium]